MFLAGDIGGTKTVLAIYEEAGDSLATVCEAVFPSRSYPTLDAIVDEFLRDQPQNVAIRAGCLGIAGMVIDGKTRTTNLPWNVEEAALADRIGATRVKLLNDLEAAAYGMLFLKPDESVVLQSGASEHRSGNVGVLAAGTGLGEAMLFWDGQNYHPIASEGGHADFGPRTSLEIGLLQYLGDQFKGHVSWERVLSGPAFQNIYRYLRDAGHEREEPAVAKQMANEDPNATISRLGLEGTDPLCVATLELFCSIYGSEAGNVALRSVATGGVFLGGGIAPKILPALGRGAFTEAFSAKGRYREFLERIEVRVVLNPRAPLLGAAHYALRLTQGA
jgi:glucokinase